MDQKNSSEIRTNPCPDCIFCGEKGTIVYRNLKDILFGAPGFWNTLRCPRCGLFWLDPCPIPEDIGKTYHEYYTHTAKDGGKPRFSALKKSLSNQVWTKYYGYRGLIKPSDNFFGKLLSFIPPVKESVSLSIMGLNASLRGNLLDIGSGNGEFLSNMRDLGWQVHGVEPDEKAIRYAKEVFNLELHQGTLESVSFPENTFDVVTMNHVIEHVYDPIDLVRECRRILKQGGRLVIVTPNVDSLGHRLFKKNWRGLEPPRHLHLFSPMTMQLCADKAGLKVEMLRTTARSARSIYVGNWFLRRNLQYTNEDITWPLWIKGVVFQLAEEVFRYFRRNTGEEIWFVGVKQGDIK